LHEVMGGYRQAVWFILVKRGQEAFFVSHGQM
jgi:hypothetical protein